MSMSMSMSMRKIQQIAIYLIIILIGSIAQVYGQGFQATVISGEIPKDVSSGAIYPMVSGKGSSSYITGEITPFSTSIGTEQTSISYDVGDPLIFDRGGDSDTYSDPDYSTPKINPLTHRYSATPIYQLFGKKSFLDIEVENFSKEFDLYVNGVKPKVAMPLKGERINDENVDMFLVKEITDPTIKKPNGDPYSPDEVDNGKELFGNLESVSDGIRQLSKLNFNIEDGMDGEFRKRVINLEDKDPDNKDASGNPVPVMGELKFWDGHNGSLLPIIEGKLNDCQEEKLLLVDKENKWSRNRLNGDKTNIPIKNVIAIDLGVYMPADNAANDKFGYESFGDNETRPEILISRAGVASRICARSYYIEEKVTAEAKPADIILKSITYKPSYPDDPNRPEGTLDLVIDAPVNLEVKAKRTPGIESSSDGDVIESTIGYDLDYDQPRPGDIDFTTKYVEIKRDTIHLTITGVTITDSMRPRHESNCRDSDCAGGCESATEVNHPCQCTPCPSSTSPSDEVSGTTEATSSCDSSCPSDGDCSYTTTSPENCSSKCVGNCRPEDWQDYSGVSVNFSSATIANINIPRLIEDDKVGADKGIEVKARPDKGNYMVEISIEKWITSLPSIEFTYPSVKSQNITNRESFPSREDITVDISGRSELASLSRKTVNLTNNKYEYTRRPFWDVLLASVNELGRNITDEEFRDESQAKPVDDLTKNPVGSYTNPTGKTVGVGGQVTVNYSGDIKSVEQAIAFDKPLEVKTEGAVLRLDDKSLTVVDVDKNYDLLEPTGNLAVKLNNTKPREGRSVGSGVEIRQVIAGRYTVRVTNHGGYTSIYELNVDGNGLKELQTFKPSTMVDVIKKVNELDPNYKIVSVSIKLDPENPSHEDKAKFKEYLGSTK